MNVQKEGLIKSQLFAKSLGGELLTREYNNSMIKMLWKCGVNEHAPFFKSLDKVKTNQWCGQCRKDGKKVIFSEKIALANWNKENLEKIKVYLVKHNATLLSNEYKSLVATLDIKCNICNNINKETSLTIFNDKYKCINCSNYQNSGLLKAKKLAIEMNGFLLSKTYIGNKEKLEWKCANEQHSSFFLSYNKVSSVKQWCPECTREKINKKNEYLNNIKKQKLEQNSLNVKNKITNYGREETLMKIKDVLNNLSISVKTCEYKNQLQFIDLQCNSCLHEWKSQAKGILGGIKGCPMCFPKEYNSRNKKRRSNEQMRIEVEEYIEKLDGKVLKYLPMGRGVFSCMVNEHDSWETKVKDVIDGSWCRLCAIDKKRNLNKENIQKIAENNMGHCLNPEIYKNNKTLLTWKCNNEEHSPWQAHYHSINTLGSWCPECATNNRSENRTRGILEYLLNFQLEKAYPTWLLNDLTERKMELDGFNAENKIAFEFQGEQHYKLAWNMSEDALKQIQYRDELKKKLCKENDVILLIIDESSKTKRFDGLLEEIINSLNENAVSYKKDIDEQKIKELFDKY